MGALENRVLDSQREMRDMDNLEEIKAMNARHLQIDPLEALQLEDINDEDKNKAEQQLTEEDEELIRSIRFGSSNGDAFKRLTREDEESADQQRKRQRENIEAKLKTGTSNKEKAKLPIVLVKKKRRIEGEAWNTTTSQKKLSDEEKVKAQKLSASENQTDLATLLGGYGSDCSSD